MASYTHKSEININAGLNINLNSKAEEEIKRLSDSVDNLKEELKSAYEDIKQLTSELDNTRSSKGIDELEAKVLKFESTSKKAAAEFKAFLQASDLVDVDGTGLEKFKELMDQIIAGSKTMQQAVVQVKSEYTEFFKSGESASGAFDSQAIQQFTASIEAMSSTLEGVHKIVSDIQANGVQVSGAVSGVGDSAATTLEKIQEAARGMDNELKGAYDAITNLTKAIVEYANTDNTKLFAVSNTFKSIADIGSGKFGGKSLQNLLDFLSKAKTVTGTQGLDIKISSDLDKLNGFKISKTVGDNLDLFAKAVNKLDVDKLQNVANVNFDNLTNMKFSKGNAKNLADLAEVYRTVKELQDQVGTGGTRTTRDTAIEVDTKKYSDALSKIDALQTKLTTNATKWAAAQNSGLKDTYNEYTAQITRLGELKTSLESGTLTSKEFSNTLADISQKSSEAGNKLAQGLIAGTKEYSSAMEQISGLTTKVQENIQKWSSISGIESNADFGNYQAQIASLDSLRQSLENGTLTAEEFKSKFAAIKLAVTESGNAVKLFVNEQNQADASNQKIVNGSKEYYQSLDKINKMLAQVRNGEREWTAAKNGSSADAYKDYVAQGAALEDLANKLKSGEITVNEFNEAVARIASVMSESSNAISSAGEATKSFSDRFGSIAKNLSIYFGASRILMTAIRTFKDMVKTAMEIENSMNQLQIVTGATDQEMQSFFDSASRQAQELGKSITDVAKSIETFSRLGYDLVDAEELSKYANILSNVANTDVNTATTGLTSIIKGYGMDVSEAEHVADVLTQVGQKYAISAEELMAAFQRGGAALYASGTDFEKSAALFAATNASLQNAEAVGKFLCPVA